MIEVGHAQNYHAAHAVSAMTAHAVHFHSLHRRDGLTRLAWLAVHHDTPLDPHRMALCELVAAERAVVVCIELIEHRVRIARRAVLAPPGAARMPGRHRLDLVLAEDSVAVGVELGEMLLDLLQNVGAGDDL